VAKLEFALGGQSMSIEGGVATTVLYSHHTQKNDRFYGIVEHDNGSYELSLTVNQTPKLAAVCPSVDFAKNLAQAWEQLAISADDLTYQVLVENTNKAQRESIAKIDLQGKHAPKKVRDVRVSAVGTPAAARGFSRYAVTYKIEAPPDIYVGGTQVYP
jgi:hypothetical protein